MISQYALIIEEGQEYSELKINLVIETINSFIEKLLYLNFNRKT